MGLQELTRFINEELSHLAEEVIAKAAKLELQEIVAEMDKVFDPYEFVNKEFKEGQPISLPIDRKNYRVFLEKDKLTFGNSRLGILRSFEGDDVNQLYSRYYARIKKQIEEQLNTLPF